MELKSFALVMPAVKEGSGMTLSVFLASMTAIGIAALVIYALTSKRHPPQTQRRAVHSRSDHRDKDRPPPPLK
jgi:hypothetical protein